MNWLCKRGWHKFRARYNEEPSGYNLKANKVEGRGCDPIEELRSILIIKEYVFDICLRCGKVMRE